MTTPGEQARQILRRFEATAKSEPPLRRPGHAAIARVWIVDDRFVLRARDRGADALAIFGTEQRLLALARDSLPFHIPALEPTVDGRSCVLTADGLWTLHRRLPGRVLHSWQLLHRAPEADRLELLDTLGTLQRSTRGLAAKADPLWLVRDIERRLAGLVRPLRPEATDRLVLALARMRDFAAALRPADAVFVHGDFHWANLLVDESGKVTGMLDLDWCRMGHPCEDLAYTTMMLLRDYDAKEPRLDWLAGYLEHAELPPAHRAIFGEYLLLFTFYDVHLFQEASSLKRRRTFEACQRRLLNRLCANQT